MGAHNLFVGEEWQERVADLCRRVQLVVLAAGDTPGVLWEVKYMLDHLDPSKVSSALAAGLRWDIR